MNLPLNENDRNYRSTSTSPTIAAGESAKFHWPPRRDRSLLTGGSELEPVASLPNFPVYMGCVSTPKEQDIFADLSFSIPKDTGAIQLDQVPPPELVYLTPHADAIGQTWHMHHHAFAEFVGACPANKVLEIGGGAGALAANYLEQWPDSHWTIIEPNPQPLPESVSSSVTVINEYFQPNLTIGLEPDAIVCSHVLEHSEDPVQFLRDVTAYLTPGGRLILSVPDMREWLARKYTSCLNFEHTVLLTEPMLDALFEREGFEILEKGYVGDSHSIFYSTKYVGNRAQVDLPQEYTANKRLFTEFIDHYQQLIKTLNAKISAFDGPVYLFGAHVAVPFLLAFGLDRGKIKGILDNSKLKAGRRLYGTSFLVNPAEAIRNEREVGVVITVPPYRDEILEQLKSLNPSTTIID